MFFNQTILCLALIAFVIILLVCFYVLHRIGYAEFDQLFVLFLSGLIQLFAGVSLFKSIEWESVQNLPGVLALIPTLMDMKGNLELTMTSRMSTLANNTDQMKTISSLARIIKQNMILIQCQASIVSLLAIGITSMYLHCQSVDITLNRLIMLNAIALCTSSITCSLIGSLMTLIISYLSRYVDPDDVATPITSSFGDLMTVILILNWANFFYKLQKMQLQWVYFTIIGGLWILFCFLIFGVLKSPYSRRIMFEGYPPLIISTIISMVSGSIFEDTTNKYRIVSLILPMMCGSLGNCITIVTCLLGTTLNRLRLHRESVTWFLSPKDVFCKYKYNRKISKTCRSHLLYAMTPCHFVYLLVIAIFYGEKFLKVTIIFTLSLLLIGFLLLSLMVFITCNLVHLAFKLKMNPGDNVIPVMTSVVDLCSSCSLVVFFKLMSKIKDPNTVN